MRKGKMKTKTSKILSPRESQSQRYQLEQPEAQGYQLEKHFEKLPTL